MSVDGRWAGAGLACLPFSFVEAVAVCVFLGWEVESVVGG